MIIFSTASFTNVLGAARTWIGAGAGGAGTDFNDAANWTGSGALLSTDDLTIDGTSTAIISLSASVTVNSITITNKLAVVNGRLKLNASTYVLTVNGDVTANSDPTSDATSLLKLQVGDSPGLFKILGTCSLGMNDWTASAVCISGFGEVSRTGLFEFDGDLLVGYNGATGLGNVAVLFDGNGAQAFTNNSVVIGSAQDFTFNSTVTIGSVNNPTVTVSASAGASSQGIKLYNSSTNVVINGTSILDLDVYRCNKRTGSGGTFTLAAGAKLKLAGLAATSNFPLGFTTYTLNGTVEYDAGAAQTISKRSNGTSSSVTYTNLTLSGTSAKTLGANTTVNGILAIEGSGPATFALGGFTLTYGAAATLQYNASGGAQTTSTAEFPAAFAGSGGVIIDNTSGVTLNANKTINLNLTLISGTINLNGFTLTLGTAVGSPGTLNYTAGWMYGGTFTRWFTTSTIADGAVTGLFPVGTSTDYRPFYVYTGGTGPSAGGTLSMTHTDPGTGPTTVAFLDGSGNTVVRRTDRSWLLTAANSFNIAINNLNVRIEGTNIGATGNVNDLRVTLSASCIGSNGVNGGTTSNPIIRRITLPAFTAASNTFYVGSVDATVSPLPVEFLSFDVKPHGKKMDITWETASEFNSDYFLVQRSKDGTVFEDVVQVPAAGISTTAKNYFSSDYEPYSGLSYYRLKQTDYNGSYYYSNVVPVEFNTRTDMLNVYPTFSDGDFTISFKCAQGKEMLLTIRNILGQEFYSRAFVLDNGLFAQFLNLSGELNSGIYVVEAFSDDRVFAKRIVIQ